MLLLIQVEWVDFAGEWFCPGFQFNGVVPLTPFRKFIKLCLFEDISELLPVVHQYQLF